MHIFHIIGHLSTLSWLFLPITQRRSKYFYYFLLLAITGLYGAFVFTFQLGPPNKIILAAGILLIPSLFKEFFGKHRTVLIISGIFIYLISYNLNAVFIEWTGVVIDVIVLVIMSAQIIKGALYTNKIKIVWTVLAVYHFSLVIKCFVLLMGPDQNTGIVLFYYTTIFQILVGIFLLFAREENPKLIVEMK